MEDRDSPLEYEWNAEFHGVEYIVNVTASDKMLTIEVENAGTSERWSGQFTAHHIEETTHKVGNLKKYPVFIKMLCSSFTKDNENVIVDILSPTELELMKSMKMGSRNNNTSMRSEASVTGENSGQSRKRYVILTYTSEFDKSHYPLPLQFEDVPNYPALRRTITRLRRKLIERESQEREPVNDKEREMKQIISQLRQDNTELRHRLRHSGNAATSSSTANFSALNSSALHANAANTDLSNANAKLQRQVDSLKRELQESSVAFERLRTESAREIARWKLKIGGSPSVHDGSPASTRGANSPGGDGGSALVSELRRQLVATQKELKFERLSRGTHTTGKTWSRSPEVNSWNNTGRTTYNRSYSADRATRSSSAGRLTSTSPQTGRAVRDTPPSSRGGWAGADRNTRPHSGGIAGRSGSPNLTRPTSNQRNNREVSPSLRSRGGTPTHTTFSPSRRASPSAVSSSLGARFNPTDYQREKANRMHSAKPAWGAGVTASPATKNNGRYRYSSPSAGESGYASANSQSSNGSRRSQRSASSQGSQGSRQSDSRKKKSTKKKSSASAGVASGHLQSNTESQRWAAATTGAGTNAKSKATKVSSGVAGRSDGVAAQMLMSSQIPVHRTHTAHTTQPSPRNFTGVRDSVSGHAINHSAHGPNQVDRSRPVPTREQRRSRESPDGDSETDDSEFLAPHHSSNHANSRNSAEYTQKLRVSAEWKRDRPTTATGSRAGVASEGSPGVTTAYNTYINAGRRPSTDSVDTETRKSHDQLVALAEKRSEFLVRGEENVYREHSDSETHRKIASGLRQSFDRSVDQSMESLPSRTSAAPSQTKVQSKPQSKIPVQSSARSTAPAVSSARSVGESWETAEFTQRASTTKNLRTSRDDLSQTSPNPASSRARRSTDSAAREGGARDTGARSLASSTTSLHTTGTGADSLMPGPEEDISAIDKRIQALTSYLENARSGLAASSERP